MFGSIVTIIFTLLRICKAFDCPKPSTNVYLNVESVGKRIKDQENEAAVVVQNASSSTDQRRKFEAIMGRLFRDASKEASSIFPGCVKIITPMDSEQDVASISRIISTTRTQVDLQVLSKSSGKQDPWQQTHKPVFDVTTMILDNNGEVVRRVTRPAKTSPSWKVLDIAFRPIGRTTPSPVDLEMVSMIVRSLGLPVKYQPSKSYNELASLLRNASADMSISNAAHNFYRYRIGIEFSRVLNEATFYFKYKIPGPVDKLNTITYPFTLTLWILTAITLLVVFAFLLTDNYLMDGGSFFIVATVTFGAVCAEPVPDSCMKSRLKSLPTWTVTFAWILMASVLTSAYKSTLLASLVSVSYERPLNTFQDLLDNNIPLFYRKGSIFTAALKESPRKALREIEKQTSQRDFYYTSATAKSLNKLLYEGKAAGVTTRNLVSGERHLVRLGTEVMTSTFSGYYYRLKNPFAPEIDMVMNWIQDAGIYQHISSRSYWSRSRPERDHERNTPDETHQDHPLDTRHVFPTLLSLGVGLTAAIVVFVAEKMKKCGKRSAEPRAEDMIYNK